MVIGRPLYVAIVLTSLAGCLAAFDEDATAPSSDAGSPSTDRVPQTFSRTVTLTFLASEPRPPGADPCPANEVAIGSAPRTDFEISPEAQRAVVRLAVEGGSGTWRYCAKAGGDAMVVEGSPPLELDLPLQAATAIELEAMPLVPPVAERTALTFSGDLFFTDT